MCIQLYVYTTFLGQNFGCKDQSQNKERIGSKRRVGTMCGLLGPRHWARLITLPYIYAMNFYCKHLSQQVSEVGRAGISYIGVRPQLLEFLPTCAINYTFYSNTSAENSFHLSQCRQCDRHLPSRTQQKSYKKALLTSRQLRRHGV